MIAKSYLRRAVLAVLALAGSSAYAASLDLTFNYRLTPTDGALTTIATARFEDFTDATGRSGVDLRLTNVASNQIAGVGATSYISGLLLAFDYSEAALPSILIEQFTDDSAQSDRWEPQEDVVTVDGFTFTSELGFPRTESSSSLGARLAVGDTAHVQFVDAGSFGDTPLPKPLTVATLIAALRGANAPVGAPTVAAAIKVRSIPHVTGGENIESVPTVVVAAPANQAPTAIAGVSASAVYEGQTVGLTGAGRDPEQLPIAGYRWVQSRGVTVQLVDPATGQSGGAVAAPRFVAPTIAGDSETLAFDLTVTDSAGAASPAATATVTVLKPKPIASAGTDQAALPAGTVILDGAASAVQVGTAQYRWRQIDQSGFAVTLNDPTAARPQFQAPSPDRNTILSFELTVTDGLGYVSAPSTVNVNVKRTNNAPVANAGLSGDARAGTVRTLDGSASADPDFDGIRSYEWTQVAGPAVRLNGADQPKPSFDVPPSAIGATLQFALRVFDGELFSAPANVTIRVVENAAPTAAAPSNLVVNEGEPVVLNAASTDPDGDALTFQWTQRGGAISPVLDDATQPSLRFVAPAVNRGGADLVFVLTVTDALGAKAESTVNLHIRDDFDELDCSNAKPNRASLFNATRGLVDVFINGVTGPEPYRLKITRIQQDEPVTSRQTGDRTRPDARIVKRKANAEGIAAQSVQLRAERQTRQTATANGRHYVIEFTATDKLGGACSGSVAVDVPIDAATDVTDDGLRFNSVGGR